MPVIAGRGSGVVVPTGQVIVSAWDKRLAPETAGVPALLAAAIDIAKCQWSMRVWVLQRAVKHPDATAPELLAREGDFPVHHALELAVRRVEIEDQFARHLPGDSAAPPLEFSPGEAIENMARAWTAIEADRQIARYEREHGRVPPDHGAAPNKRELEHWTSAYEAMVADLTAGRRHYRLPDHPTPAESTEDRTGYASLMDDTDLSDTPTRTRRHRVSDEQLGFDIDVEQTAWGKWVDPDRRAAQVRKFLDYAQIPRIPTKPWPEDSPELKQLDTVVERLFPDLATAMAPENADMADAFICFLGECFIKFAGARWEPYEWFGRDKSFYDDVNPMLEYGFDTDGDTAFGLMKVMIDHYDPADGGMFAGMAEMMREFAEEYAASNSDT
ncbi:hypothetical protein [Nocardia panacis]|uniref:hypothetical protein n=1 Tax=Nocardia panacis TaxID=2340916 RepID=UPI0011C3DBA7|nr:hypothetical protein [Nocardia panacis]